MKTLSVVLILVLIVAKGAAHEMTGDVAANKRLQNPSGTPAHSYMNINNISTVYRNDGTADIDVAQRNPGLVFPKGSGRTTMYSSGFLWAANVPGDSQVRVGGSAYSSGLQPGKYLAGGIAEDPNLSKNRIYRVRPDWRAGDLSSEISNEGMTAEEIRTQYERDWNEWPWQDGAPFVDVDGNNAYSPEVDVPGVEGASQTIWFVANDGNTANVYNLYGTQPVGMECQFTCWAYAQEGALGNMLFRSFLMINRGTSQLDSMYACMWSDPDLGSADDDLVGCDTSLNLGFVYNANAVDAKYAPLPPPAAGFDFLQGPMVASAGNTAIFRGRRLAGFRNLPMTAFFYFIKSNPNLEDPTRSDPSGSTQMYNFMRGRIGRSGEFFEDPQGDPTTFCLTGDPVAGTGWLDGRDFPADDRRMGLSSGPFSMAPGDTQEVVVAEICAGAITGVDRLSAVSLLRFYDRAAQWAYDNFFDLQTPLQPQLLLPPIHAQVETTSVTLRWSKPRYADWFELEVNTDSTFAGFSPFDRKSVQDTFAVTNGLSRDVTYFWRVTAKNIMGEGPSSDTWSFHTTQGLTAVPLAQASPTSFMLAQNYPNPFNPTTTIGFTVAGVVAPSGAILSGVEGPVASGQQTADSRVRLAVYDLLGREVAVLLDENKAPGTYRVEFDGAKIASGIYICRMTAGDYVESKKMLLMK